MRTPEVLARLTAHWPMLGGSDDAARVRLEDWRRVVDKNAPAVRSVAIETLITGWDKDRPPKLADWQETARQAIQRRPELLTQAALEGPRCLQCEGAGWLWHTEGKHWTIGNTVTGSRLHDATPEHPILERCPCGAVPGRVPEPEQRHWTEEEMAHNRARIAALIAQARDTLTDAQRKIRREGYNLAPQPPSIHATTDIPGGPPFGEKHMTPEERQAELDAIGDRKIRKRTL